MFEYRITSSAWNSFQILQMNNFSIVVKIVIANKLECLKVIKHYSLDIKFTEVLKSILLFAYNDADEIEMTLNTSHGKDFILGCMYQLCFLRAQLHYTLKNKNTLNFKMFQKFDCHKLVVKDVTHFMKYYVALSKQLSMHI